MRYIKAVLAILFVSFATFAAALAIPTSADDKVVVPDQFSFLKPGRDYVISFPADRHPLVAYSTTCDIFRVVRHRENGSSSWVLLEHPTSPADMGTWLLKHWAPFLPEEPRGMSPDELAHVKEAVASEIELERTWVNLNHAVTVRPVSAQSLGLNDLGLSN